MTKRKVEFWWASISGADLETVEVVEQEGGGKLVYTCGCGDPFILGELQKRDLPGINNFCWWDEANKILLVDEMEAPKHPDVIAAERKEAAEKYEAMIEAERRGNKTYQFRGETFRIEHHGWRGPR